MAMDDRLFEYAVNNDCVNVQKILMRCEPYVNINRQHIDYENSTALMLASKSKYLNHII